MHKSVQGLRQTQEELQDHARARSRSPSTATSQWKIRLAEVDNEHFLINTNLAGLEGVTDGAAYRIADDPNCSSTVLGGTTSAACRPRCCHCLPAKRISFNHEHVDPASRTLTPPATTGRRSSWRRLRGSNSQRSSSRHYSRRHDSSSSSRNLRSSRRQQRLLPRRQEQRSRFVVDSAKGDLRLDGEMEIDAEAPATPQQRGRAAHMASPPRRRNCHATRWRWQTMRLVEAGQSRPRWPQRSLRHGIPGNVGRVTIHDPSATPTRGEERQRRFDDPTTNMSDVTGSRLQKVPGAAAAAAHQQQQIDTWMQQTPDLEKRATASDKCTTNGNDVQGRLHLGSRRHRQRPPGGGRRADRKEVVEHHPQRRSSARVANRVGWIGLAVLWFCTVTRDSFWGVTVLRTMVAHSDNAFTYMSQPPTRWTASQGTPRSRSKTGRSFPAPRQRFAP